MTDVGHLREYAAEMEAKCDSLCNDCDRLVEKNTEMLDALHDIAGGRMNVTDDMLSSELALKRAFMTFAQERARAAIAKATGAK